jgi:hypothetical protein
MAGRTAEQLSVSVPFQLLTELVCGLKVTRWSPNGGLGKHVNTIGTAAAGTASI